MHPFGDDSSLPDTHSLPTVNSFSTLLLPNIEQMHSVAQLVSQTVSRGEYQSHYHHRTHSCSHQNHHVKHSSTETSEGHRDLSRNGRNVPKQRRRLSRDETEYLLDRFQELERPTAKERVKFAEKLSLHPKTIQIWFQNRRAKLRKDESIAREMRFDREDDDDCEGNDKDSNGYQRGTSLLGSNSGSTENHHRGSGAETFIGFVGSPSSEDLEYDPDWGELAEGTGRSVDKTSYGVITTEDSLSTSCDGIYSPRLLEKLSAGLHIGLGIDSFCSDGLADLTDLTGWRTLPSLENEGTDIAASKNGSTRSTPARTANANNHIPRHQMALTLVPNDLLSIYIRDAASSWDLCS